MDLFKVKKLLIIAILGILITLVFVTFIFFSIIKSKPAKIINPSITPIATVAVFPKAILPDTTGNTVDINGIKMDNFFVKSKKINQVGDVMLVETSDYGIVYLAIFKQFMISIKSSQFEKVLPYAEQELLRILNISQTKACLLNISITTPLSVNPNRAGEDYRLSFCK